ncbi:TPA: reverse transcriptase domain-containing protein [Salmonella enterica subsp. enterica serovar Kottbus]
MWSIPKGTWRQAWQWLCRRRKKAPAGADIWHLRFHREQILPDLIRAAESGTYRLSPMQVVRRRHGQESLLQWCARDALVLKWVSLQVAGRLPFSPRCTHTAGHRGGRDGLQAITRCLQEGYTFVYRTDIRGYYRHIRKAQLKQHVNRFVPEPHLKQLIHQYVDYSVEDGGEFYTPPSGIPRGCALSPLLGASFLWYVDGGFEREEGMFYVRYMDDFLYLSQRRWPVRRAIARLHRYFDDTGFTCHPNKTMVGRTTKGFDWLGVWFDERGPAGIAPRAQENHRTRCLRLEEQTRRRGMSEEAVRARVQQYEVRWRVWADCQLQAAKADW